MLLKALDLLRELGFGIIQFIYNFIDAIYDIIKKLNELDIVGTMANNKIFTNFYSAVILIALTVFSLFIVWQFIKKVVEPEESPNSSQIITEIIKCGVGIFLSTFMFLQVSTFSIQLSGYISSMFQNQNSTLGSEMLISYIDYNGRYKESEKFTEDDFAAQVRNGTFSKNQNYNDKFVLKEHFIRSDERDYKYEVEWILAILCGGFFLYASVFSAILLGKRQIEFLFLFLISPVVYATSICNKQRRNAVVEQLTSLTLQSAVIVLIINIVALLAIQINATTFFTNSFQNMLTKSLLYLGCATFLLTGSQTVNRFIGSNISASAGREQLMSLLGYGKLAKGAGIIGAGAGLVGAGSLIKGGNDIFQKSGIAPKMGYSANNALQKIGTDIANFAQPHSGTHLPDGSPMFSSKVVPRSIERFGNSIMNYGQNLTERAEKRNDAREGIGIQKKLNHQSNKMVQSGLNMISPKISRMYQNRRGAK